ncbi:MAG: carotenoid oxygenase family protein [Gammaproteobacteria bacterium]|nr:carotenoid oxygenase family protein [Gammaproteobacteria bacterium]
MASPYPEHPQLSGNFAPLRSEIDAHDLVVHGEIPVDLAGTLLRIGPNPQYAPLRDHHWFLGDGMVHGFYFESGKVRYRNRWVRTPRFELEREHGESLFGMMGNPATTAKVAAGKDNGVANTALVFHANRLLALEELHAPFEIDRQSLDSLGYYEFDGQLKGAMTAHPKIDPQTGEMLFFCYFGNGPFTPEINFHVVDAKGKLLRSEQFKAPFPAMVHDFVVTSDYVLFPIFPLTADLDRAVSGGPPFAWEPEKGTWVGVMRRSDSVDNIRWLRTDPCYVFHPMNAWNDGERIYADMMQFEEAPLFPHADGSPTDPKKANARLCRWYIDLGSDSDAFTREYIDDLSAEFPRIDERRAGLDYKHGFYATSEKRDEGDKGAFNGIAHLDLATGKRRDFKLPGGDAVSEPVFVRRSDAAEEGDGYLLATAYRCNENRSDLLIFDTDDIARGPIAVANLDTRVPYGFHGQWVSTNR